VNQDICDKFWGAINLTVRIIFCQSNPCSLMRRLWATRHRREDRTWVAWQKMILTVRSIAPQSLSQRSWFTLYILIHGAPISLNFLLTNTFQLPWQWISNVVGHWYNVSKYFNYIQYIIFYTLYGLKRKAAIPQAVSCQLLTMMAQVPFQIRSYEICGWQSGTKSGFLWLLRLPLPILIPLTAP
jgi:hypothetical protein